MKTQEKAEQEIKLIELFWEILFAWRQVFCLAIIIAILVSGMKYLFDNRAYRIAQNGEIEQEAEFTAEEEEQIEEARIMMKRIEDYQKYLNESALMQIDPYEKPVVELQYYV